MSQNFQPGDFLVFQLEAGFALLRVLGVDAEDGDIVWHVAAYEDFYLDVDHAETAALAGKLRTSHAHIALTNRAFESTQVAKIANVPLTGNELEPFEDWNRDGNSEVSDRSVRLMLGYR
ncbi:hypothetical protein BH10ACI2_BH10ACI2_20180 [soil metagenome]